MLVRLNVASLSVSLILAGIKCDYRSYYLPLNISRCPSRFWKQQNDEYHAVQEVPADPDPARLRVVQLVLVDPGPGEELLHDLGVAVPGGPHQRGPTSRHGHIDGEVGMFQQRVDNIGVTSA